MRYLGNCFLLLVPVLLVNALYAHALPAPWQPEVFWRDIPPALAFGENGARLFVVVLPALVPLGRDTPGQRRGLTLYALGLAGYLAAWAALVLAPTSAWSTSAVGFTAAAWTPALWLAGLVLLAERSFLPHARSLRAPLGVGAVVFVVLHVAHAALVFSRTATFADRPAILGEG